jgi:UDP-galactopyranose mutase
MSLYDILVIGCGFAGSVFAERCASQRNLKVLMIDKRDHIAGNAFDQLDSNGNLIHVYGPHYFRTNSDLVFNYLSQFTEWRNVNYEILSWANNQFWNFPINLNTFEQFIGKSSTSEEMHETLELWKVPIISPSNSEEVIISQVGIELYNLFFKNYTRKQWKCDPKDLDSSVCGRIPIRVNRDNRYFNDRIQAIPSKGYTQMFKNIVDHPLITVELGLSLKELISTVPYTSFKKIVYTGPIDEYFNYEYGQLPYRSLRFEKETHDIEFYQPSVQVNYPNDFDFTRIVETKHITGLQTKSTTIVKEYPAEFLDTNEPFYPVPNPMSKHQYDQYHSLVKQQTKILFLGRLATYQYLNMDQVVGMALSKFEKSF